MAKYELILFTAGNAACVTCLRFFKKLGAHF